MKEVKSFNILEEILPTWYFNVFPENQKSYSTCYFNSSVMSLSEDENSIVKKDERYKTKIAQDLDIGYQLWNRGSMLKINDIPFEKLIHKEEITTEDNYIFMRKYFRMHIVYYYFLKRLISFHNPFSEFKAFSKTKNVKKIDLINPHMEYPDYKNYTSDLLKKKPLISVIIPTLSR